MTPQSKTPAAAAVVLRTRRRRTRRRKRVAVGRRRKKSNEDQSSSSTGGTTSSASDKKKKKKKSKKTKKAAKKIKGSDSDTGKKQKGDDNKASDLLLDSSDDSNTAKVPAASGWKLEDAQKLGLFLDTLIKLDAETRPPVTELQTHIQGIPEGVLVAWDLKTVTDGLLAKSKYPSSANLKKILQAYRDMGQEIENILYPNA